MSAFWNYQFTDSPDFIDTFDELPLWSAPFGLLLLKHIQLRHHLNVLDIGSGAGFPLLELAERLGPTCKCYGLDPWHNANIRARKKMHQHDVHNVEVLEGSAEQIPLPNGSIDLIVSNLGINNFEHPAAVFKECCRVLKPAGKLALTTNLNGHWKEFYAVFESTLRQLGKPELVAGLAKEQAHRGTVNSISGLFTESGLNIISNERASFEMRFLDGTSFLNHHFIKLANIRRRVQLFSGNINVNSAPGEGYDIAVEIPVHTHLMMQVS